MNIGFDAKRAFNNATGLGNYSRTLIQGLVQFYPSNQYFLFTPAEGINFLQKASNIITVKPQHFLHRKIKWYWRSFYLPKEQRDAGLKIYHGLSNELPFGKPPMGVKQVVTIHDLIFLKYPQFYPLIDRNIYEMKVRHSCKIADCIIAVSEQTKRDLIEWLPFTKDKIKVVYQSCNPIFERNLTDAELNSVKEKFKLPDNYVLYVGAVSERKNLLNLVKAFRLVSNVANINLIIIGEGTTYKRRVEDLIKSLGLTGRTRIISNVETEDLPAIYRMARLFAYPSVYEGFGIPIVEALCSKVPVIATQGGCFPEAGGPHSCYADTDDVKSISEKMLEVLTNENLRERMIRKGAEYAQQFTLKEVSKNMMEIYNDFLSGKNLQFGNRQL